MACKGLPTAGIRPDPDTFVTGGPIGRYRGVTEMIEMSKTPGQYKQSLTPGVAAGPAVATVADALSHAYRAGVPVDLD